MFNPRIYTFLTLYKEMNYRRTAELLNMTQPGVTQHIQYLEKRYSVRLFRYQGRELSRTREAEIFKRHLDSMMAQEHAMRAELAGQQGLHMNIGATKTVGEFVLVPVVRRFLADPQHSLNFVIDNTRTLMQQLEDGALDFAVVEGVIDKTRYGCRLFQKEKFVGICSRQHPFAGRTVSLKDIFTQTLLLREKGSGTRRLLEQAVEERGFSVDCFARTVSVSNFSVMMDLLAEGQSITFAYQPVVGHRPELATFAVRDMHIEGEFNFVYCNQEIAEEKIRLFFGE